MTATGGFCSLPGCPCTQVFPAAPPPTAGSHLGRWGRSDFDLLHSYGSAEPSDDELDLVIRARGFVHALGLDVPRHEVEWFTATDEVLPYGFCTPPRAHERPLRIQLRVGLAPRTLVEVVLHELQHLADCRDTDLSVPELEARAEAFATRHTDRLRRELGIQ